MTKVQIIQSFVLTSAFSDLLQQNFDLYSNVLGAFRNTYHCMLCIQCEPTGDWGFAEPDLKDSTNDPDLGEGNLFFKPISGKRNGM